MFSRRLTIDAWPLVGDSLPVDLLFRFVYDPSGLYERNPDHCVTARAVESAFWMASIAWDYPEHFRAGLTAHFCRSSMVCR